MNGCQDTLFCEMELVLITIVNIKKKFFICFVVLRVARFCSRMLLISKELPINVIPKIILHFGHQTCILWRRHEKNAIKYLRMLTALIGDESRVQRIIASLCNGQHYR